MDYSNFLVIISIILIGIYGILDISGMNNFNLLGINMTKKHLRTDAFFSMLLAIYFRLI